MATTNVAEVVPCQPKPNLTQVEVDQKSRDALNQLTNAVNRLVELYFGIPGNPATVAVIVTSLAQSLGPLAQLGWDLHEAHGAH